MRLGTRHGPSGGRLELQLPFYGCTPPAAAPGDYFVLLGVPGSSLITGDAEDTNGSYLILQGGKLGTLLVQNAQIGSDAVNVVYQARLNLHTVGPRVIIPNNAVGPVKVDLTGVILNPGDTVGVIMTVPAFSGSPPISKLGFTWIPQ